MKKNRGIILFVITLIVFQTMPVISYGAEKMVTVNIPTFRVQINGTVVDSSTAEFPLLVYKDITYMPMTYDFCNLIGLKSSWTKEEGLNISIRNDDSIPTVTETKNNKKNSSKVIAYIAEIPITVNNQKIDNSKETYPFLIYKDITYFPLTFKWTKEAFNIYNNFNYDIGLQIYSENRFFYKYYPDNNQKQYTDFRVSTILFEMAAINISDGSDKYPSNNVALYKSNNCGIPKYPEFVGTKYYGYQPDGNGGLKVNTDSKLTPFEFYTTAISDLKNPVPEEVELF
ncbi:hypothetical protein [Anaerovorax odorimutans]|uniref:hypothetical protein n=1 Tax=Anaerovorax odorimutans TaxID=109327 RepID=UPI0004171B04|nr:hypothetical protein [Anaerovorax odorimutans]